MEKGALAVDERLLLQRNPNLGRLAAQRFAKEARRRDADHGERVVFYDERRSDHRRIASVSALACLIAEHRNRRCGGLVVLFGEQTPAKGADSEGRKIAPGDKLAAQRLGRALRVAADAHAVRAGLKRGELFELRQILLQ